MQCFRLGLRTCTVGYFHTDVGPHPAIPEAFQTRCSLSTGESYAMPLPSREMLLFKHSRTATIELYRGNTMCRRGPRRGRLQIGGQVQQTSHRTEPPHDWCRVSTLPDFGIHSARQQWTVVRLFANPSNLSTKP